jgi:hypothetical protein
MPDPLSDDRRRAIFADVVAAQDQGLAVAAARESVAARHGVSQEEVRAIEREGIEQGWPPLGD